MLLLRATLLSFVAAESWPCSAKTETAEVCQDMCDLSSDCYTWTWVEKDKQCWFKQRSGWIATEKAGYYSGFKGQKIIAENMCAMSGEVLCCSDTRGCN